MSFFPSSRNADVHGSTFIAAGRDQVTNVHNTNVSALDPLAQLSPVPDAMYNSMTSVSGCMEGTRQEVIERIVKWMGGDGKQPICWLHGAAGAGKSAISRTIAETCAKNNRLAASFSFLRGAGRRSSFTHFIPTLAFDLALSVPATRPHIENVLKKDPHILHRSLDDQFRALIIEPIRSIVDRPLSKVVRLVTRHSRPFVIVIDALDECNDKEKIARFIEIVAQIDRLPFQILFTSRVEGHIQEKFSAPPTPAKTYRLALQDFDADADLRKFFHTRFSTTYEEKRYLMKNIELPWPSETDISKLVEMSAGSFIFAFTLVNFVDDGRDLPHRKLRTCLKSHTGVDPLYIEILKTVPENPRFVQIFETIMTVTEQLSVADLACLFQMETGDVIHALLGVQSILIVPEDDNSSVRPFHTSLRDFLTTKERSELFYINPSPRHFSIASDCLKAMITSSGNSFFEHSGLKFACRSWNHHFLRAIQEGGGNDFFAANDTFIMNTLMEFVSCSFDYWLDSIIFQQEFYQTAKNLDELVSRLKGCQSLPSVLRVMEKITTLAKSDEESFRKANILKRYDGYGDDYRYGVYGVYAYLVHDAALREMIHVRILKLTCPRLIAGVLLFLYYVYHQKWRKSRPKTTAAQFVFSFDS